MHYQGGLSLQTTFGPILFQLCRGPIISKPVPASIMNLIFGNARNDAPDLEKGSVFERFAASLVLVIFFSIKLVFKRKALSYFFGYHGFSLLFQIHTYKLISRLIL